MFLMKLKKPSWNYDWPEMWRELENVIEVQ